MLDDNIFRDFVSKKCTNTLASIDKEDLRCFIAARVKNCNTVHVFEYFQDWRLRQNRLSALEVQERSVEIDSVQTAEELIYKRYKGETDIGSNVLSLEISGTDIFGKESYQVELSHNFKTVLFSNGQNRFLYEAVEDDNRENKKFIARRINHMSKGFHILHYCEDLENEGFYAICLKDFDKKIRMMHTHRGSFKLSQAWRLEKQAIRFFDLHVVSQEKVEGLRETSVTLLGLDSNKFVVSEFEVQEKLQDDTGSAAAIEHKISDLNMSSEF